MEFKVEIGKIRADIVSTPYQSRDYINFEIQGDVAIKTGRNSREITLSKNRSLKIKF